MKKEFKTRLAEMELESKKLCAEERFEEWLSEHYPGENLHYMDYMKMMPDVPEELKEKCLDQMFKAIRKIQEESR